MQPPPEMQAQIAALDGFVAPPFPLRFLPVENRKAAMLRTRDPSAEARAFQKALVHHLPAAKAPIIDGTTPGSTIAATGWVPKHSAR